MKNTELSEFEQKLIWVHTHEDEVCRAMEAAFLSEGVALTVVCKNGDFHIYLGDILTGGYTAIALIEAGVITGEDQS